MLVLCERAPSPRLPPHLELEYTLPLCLYLHAAARPPPPVPSQSHLGERPHTAVHRRAPLTPRYSGTPTHPLSGIYAHTPLLRYAHTATELMTHPLVLLRELAAGKTPRLAQLARVELHSNAPLFPASQKSSLFAASQHKQEGGARDYGERGRGRDGGGRAHSTRRGGGEQHNEQRKPPAHHGRHRGMAADYPPPIYAHPYAPQPYMPPPHFQASGGGLGQSLFPLVLARVGDGQSASKVTGLLLKLADPGAVLALIQGPPQMLDEAVAEAVCIAGGPAPRAGGKGGGKAGGKAGGMGGGMGGGKGAGMGGGVGAAPPLRLPAEEAAWSARGGGAHAAAAPHGAAEGGACAPCEQTSCNGGGQAAATEAVEAKADAEVEAVEASAAGAKAAAAEETATGAAGPAAGRDENEHRGGDAVAEGMQRCAISSGDKGGSHTTGVVAAALSS